MPLQNRVDPFGKIHAVPERGLLMGNRGVIHDPATKTLLKRRWSSQAWIICACEFKGRTREPMGRNAPSGHAGWTELFFLDEVTALAAGHRPCFYCQRARATDFLARYRAANAVPTAKAPDLDHVLHAQRLATRARPVEVDRLGLSHLPDGAMFSVDGACFAIRGGQALRWSFAGYGALIPFDRLDADKMCIVTPPATLMTIAAGYAPLWHPSATSS